MRAKASRHSGWRRFQATPHNTEPRFPSLTSAPPHQASRTHPERVPLWGALIQSLTDPVPPPGTGRSLAVPGVSFPRQGLHLGTGGLCLCWGPTGESSPGQMDWLGVAGLVHVEGGAGGPAGLPVFSAGPWTDLHVPGSLSREKAEPRRGLCGQGRPTGAPGGAAEEAEPGPPAWRRPRVVRPVTGRGYGADSFSKVLLAT